MTYRIALALAAAIAVAAPAIAAEPFNGPFVGVEAGWQQDGFSERSNGVTFSANADGFRYGAFLGYDFRAGSNAVAGLEVGLSDSTAKSELLDGRADRTVDVTARAGALVSPTSLLYGRAGYSNARGSDFDGNFGETRDGWLLGAGYEVMLGTSASARLEYNYSQYDDADTGVTPKRHALKAGVAFRF